MCCAGSRLFVQESIDEPLVEKLKQRLETLRVGDPLDKNTDVGAINSKMQLDKIRELVDAGKDEGAEIYQPPCRLPERGYWFAPTVFTNVAQSYRIAQEEIFGPVLSVLTFRTPDEAVEKANNTPYGLSAGVWTEKGSRILWMAQRLRAGVVWANTFNRFDPTSPFGGYKESGFGREGGLHGLEPYLQLRRLGDVRWLTGSPSGRRTSSSSAARSRAPSRAARTRREGAERRARLAQGRARRGAGGARGAAGLGRRDRVQPRPDPLPLAEMVEARAAGVRRALHRHATKSSARSTAVVWYAGWADKLAAGARRRRILSPARTSTSPFPSRPASSGSLAPDEPPLLGLVTRLLPPLVGGNAVVARRVRDAAARRRRARRGDRDERRARRRGQHPHRPPRRHGPDPRLAHGRERDRSLRRERLLHRARGAAADNVKRIVRGRADVQSPWEISSFLELKTVWHPIGQ